MGVDQPGTNLETLVNPDAGVGWIRHTWRRFWRNAPRQLKITRDGKVIIGLTFAIGFAAINTGNNLLFLGWGLMLSAILISGVLSEATLRPLSVSVSPPAAARVNEISMMPMQLDNAAQRLPAFAVEASGRVEDQTGEISIVVAPYQLRLEPDTRHQVGARFTPKRRGRYRLVDLLTKTSYPFGFFTKSRRHKPGRQVDFWAMPAAVDVRELATLLLSRLGEDPAQMAGKGEDFFSLRPYKHGDDLRRIHWRRSARTGRWVVIETEASRDTQVMLELCLPPVASGAGTEDARIESTISTLGSLAEELLAQGLSVGVRGPGLAVLPEAGQRQAHVILLALARLEVGADQEAFVDVPGAIRVAVVAPGAAPPITVSQGDTVIEVQDPLGAGSDS
ncbi:MAG: DUF58 domain-containing protein [Myxococcota bacterium]